MIATATALAISAAATVVGTAASISAQKKSANLQAGIAKKQQQQQELSYQRQQREALREAQIRRAQGATSAQGLGVGSTSLAYGGMSSIASQTGSALGYGSQMSGLSGEIVNMGIAANAANAKAATYNSMAGIAGGAFNWLGGPDQFRKLVLGS
jgi:hypothetical protein